MTEIIETKKVKRAPRKSKQVIPLPEQKIITLRGVPFKYLGVRRFVLDSIERVEYVLKDGTRIDTKFEGERIPEGRVEVENKTYHANLEGIETLYLLYPSSYFTVDDLDIVTLYGENNNPTFTLEYHPY